MKSCRVSFLFMLLACVLGGMTSCVSSKKMLYLQGADKLHENPQKIENNYELRIKPDDQLLITINSKAPELLTPFANSQVLGSSSSTNTQESTGLLVSQSGKIEIPVLGEMQAAGLTRQELADAIKNKLIEGEYIKDPTVLVRFKGAKIVVLGEVGSPGVKVLPYSKLSDWQVIYRRQPIGRIFWLSERKMVNVRVIALILLREKIF